MKKHDKAVEPQQEAPKKLVVRCLKLFDVTINGSFRRFYAGEIERDYITAKFLLDNNLPVVILDDKEYIQCPVCEHIMPK